MAIVLIVGIIIGFIVVFYFNISLDVGGCLFGIIIYVVLFFWVGMIL